MATEVVLFDLGGVLVELGGVEVFGAWIAEPEPERVWRHWLTSPWVRRFECGHCDADAFARGMVEEWGLELAPAEFLEAFRGWPRGLYPGARELVDALGGRVRTACFSNTNRLHWEHVFPALGLDVMFETRFLSFEMGLVKPDTEAFEHVVDRLGCEPGDVLFLDDNELNVAGARAVGLDAERVRGVAEAARALHRRALV